MERPEIKLVQEKGYTIKDPSDAVTIFEKKISDYTGAPYVTVVDSCTHSLELCLRYRLLKQEKIDKLIIPNRTYLSVPMTAKKLGLEYEFHYKKWKGYYFLEPTNIVDMALRFTKDCFIKGADCCLSFQNKKILKINRGGAILTDDVYAHNYYQLARHDGREYKYNPWRNQKTFIIGYHYNLGFDDCARGILLMDELAKFGLYNNDVTDDTENFYPDLSKLNFSHN